jgi:predicted dehydrogenase
VQVGTQQRSGPHYARARELLQQGHIGKIVSIRMQAFRNVMPGFGRPDDGPPPAGFDWDMFLGPAPLRPYNPHRGLYHFRWFWDYSGGQMTNLGQHSLDIADWYLGPLVARAVASCGGRLALSDNGETPDTQDALFDFPGLTAVWSHREASRGENAGSSLAFYGTKGSLGISRSGFTVTPDPIIRPEDAVPQFTEGQPVGGVQRSAQQQERRLHTEPVSDRTGNSLDQFRRHARNFLDCIRKAARPPSPTWKAPIAWRRSATWPMLHCGSVAACNGMRAAKPSAATIRPPPCSSEATARRGTPSCAASCHKTLKGRFQERFSGRWRRASRG